MQARDVLDLLGSLEHKLTWLEQLHSRACGCPYQAFVQDHRRACRCLMQAIDVLDLLGSPEHKLTWLKQIHSRAYGCTCQAFVQAANVQHLLERQEKTSHGCNSHRRAYGCLVQARDVLDLLGSPEHKLTWLEQLHSIAYGCPCQAFCKITGGLIGASCKQRMCWTCLVALNTSLLG